jgi:hypothetical protein
MTDALKRCLDDLEERIDPAEEERLLGEWVEFAEGRFRGAIFSPRRGRPSPPGVEWPHVGVNAALDDFDAMALQQYAMCSAQLAGATGTPLAVRANYGTSILPLLFGVEPFVMEDRLDTLPTSRPLHDSAAIRRVVDARAPDLRRGYGERVFEMGERFVEIGRSYPRIGAHVHIYHPDLQGPLDICEIVWGTPLFYALYDDPVLVRELLELVTETYSRFLRAWAEIVPFHPAGNVHWAVYHRGSIVLRLDSAMNLSGEHYEAFSKPYDQRLLDEFGGGVVHFCGRGTHFIRGMCELRGLFGVNLTQPECNDMETILANTVDRGIPLLGLARSAAEEALARGRDLRGRVHCER